MNLKYSPFTKYTKIASLMVLAALPVALSGCMTLAPSLDRGGALPYGMAIQGPPKSQWVALYARRAFTLRAVTFDPRYPDPRFGGSRSESVDYHCLPDEAYRNMLGSFLAIAWRRARLDKGEGPAIPVEVDIARMQFSSAAGFTGAHFDVFVRVRGTQTLRVPLQVQSLPVAYYGSDWNRADHFVPEMAAVIANAVQILKEGRPDLMRNYDWAEGAMPFTSAPSGISSDLPVATELLTPAYLARYGLRTYETTHGTIESTALHARIMLHSGLTVPQMKTLCRKAEKTGKVQPWPGTSRTTAAQ
ncbi:MAG: hypothetical protein ACYDHY_15265 [Acidiferrobacterales bacterium]